jgi:hypothetical protein
VTHFIKALFILILTLPSVSPAKWLVNTPIEGAFGITLGEITKSKKQRGESFTPKGDTSTFDNFYYIFAKDSRRVYDISAFTYTCNGFDIILSTLEGKYGQLSQYSPEGRSGKYYRYANGDREITLRCDKYYGFPMAISYVDNRIKASNAVVEKAAEDSKAALYDNLETIMKNDKSSLFNSL